MGKVKPRKEVQREQAQRRESFVSWLTGRLEKAKAERVKRRVHSVRQTSGSGVTLDMKQICNSVDQEVLVTHSGPNREARRHDRKHGRPVRPSINGQYVNPYRDLRKGRRLRS